MTFDIFIYRNYIFCITPINNCFTVVKKKNTSQNGFLKNCNKIKNTNRIKAVFGQSDV